MDKKLNKNLDKTAKNEVAKSDTKKVKEKSVHRGLTVKEIRDERELLRENIALQFEKFRRRTGLKVTYCEYNIDDSKDVFLAIEDI